MPLIRISKIVLRPYDNGSERNERELCELKALFAERNSDDRNAPEYAREEIGERESQTAENDPDHVCDRMLFKVGLGFSAERPERKRREFETLCAERDADDRDTP